MSVPVRVETMEQYRQLCRRSVEDAKGFWAEQAERLEWASPWDEVLHWNFDERAYRSRGNPWRGPNALGSKADSIIPSPPPDAQLVGRGGR